MEPTDLDEYFSGLFTDAFAQMLEGLDPEQLAEFDEKLPSVIEDAVPKIVKVAADGLDQSLHERAPQMLAEYRNLRQGFEERLLARWRKAFDLSQMVMVCAREAGEAFSRKHAPEAAEDNDLVFSALIRLHARACRVAEEVLALMRAGFGQAAMARWRALHEIAVVASFIKSTVRKQHSGISSMSTSKPGGGCGNTRSTRNASANSRLASRRFRRLGSGAMRCA